MGKIKEKDLVKYKTGERIYKVTRITSQNNVILDTKYVADPSKLIKLNKFSVKDKLITLTHLKGTVIEVDLKPMSTNIIYTIFLDSDKILHVDQQDLLNILKKSENENRLQEQKTTGREGDNPGVSGELCCRDSISFELGHRGNEYCLTESAEQIKKCYAKLSLGQQDLSRR